MSFHKSIYSFLFSKNAPWLCTAGVPPGLDTCSSQVTYKTSAFFWGRILLFWFQRGFHLVSCVASPDVQGKVFCRMSAIQTVSLPDIVRNPPKSPQVQFTFCQHEKRDELSASWHIENKIYKMGKIAVKNWFCFEKWFEHFLYQVHLDSSLSIFFSAAVADAENVDNWSEALGFIIFFFSSTRTHTLGVFVFLCGSQKTTLMAAELGWLCCQAHMDVYHIFVCVHTCSCS